MTTEYEALDFAEMQSEYQRVSTEPGSFGGDDWEKKFVRLPQRDGFVLMRLLPRKKGSKLYCATRVHTLMNPTTKKTKNYHCPRNLVQTARGPQWQGDCIICKWYSDMWQKSLELTGKAQNDMQDKARKLKAVERYYYNVIVRSEKDPKTGDVIKNVGPKIYSCGKTTHAKIMRAIVGDETAGEKPLGDVTNPTTGRDFRVVKKVIKGGNGQEYPNYDNSKFEDPSPLGSPDELATWIENLHDLQALRVVKSSEELRHALQVHCGMIKEGESSEEDDDLKEFREFEGNGGSTSTASDTVREELTVSSTTEEVSAASVTGDEVLADADFMNELENM